MDNRYQASADQAWLRLWVGIFGRDSQLAKFLREDDDAGEQGRQPGDIAQPRRAPPADDPRRPARRPQTARQRRPPALEKAQERRPSPVEKKARRLERDVERVTRLPVSDWARAIVGDPRNNDITLADLLTGAEAYFDAFEQMRRQHPDAYAYFRRVGAPVVTANTKIWTRQLTALTMADAGQLPSYFGAFFGRSAADYREDTLEDKATLLDFHLFEKPKNHATVAPLGSTIFAHHSLSLKRDLLSKEELAKFPHAKKSWGMWWYVGVLPTGEIRALPHHMQRYQTLPRGTGVYHSAFHVPPGLAECAKELPDESGKTAHDFVRLWFNMAVAFTASSIAGITVTIKQGKRSCRLGVPIGALKEFFYDRDAEGRRKAILHLRLGHDRHMADGRIIPVGEHLSGERFFTWRGYDITVGVPGIHFPSPEGLAAPVYIAGDPDAPLPPEIAGDEYVPVGRFATVVRKKVWTPLRVPIRKGEPVATYAGSTLPPPGDR